MDIHGMADVTAGEAAKTKLALRQRDRKRVTDVVTTARKRLAKVEVDPIYAHVAECLRDMILRGDLLPGRSLPTERELGEELGVSRSSVREALRVLQAEGYVASTGRTRPFRAVIPDESDVFLRRALAAAVRLRGVSLDDLVALRCIVEGAACELAADRAGSSGGDDDRKATTPEDCFYELTRPGLTHEEFEKWDVEFHLSLSAEAGNEALHLVMVAISGSVMSRLHDELRERHAGQETFDVLNSQHRELLSAVRSGKRELAREALEHHIAGFYNYGKRVVECDWPRADLG